MDMSIFSPDSWRAADIASRRANAEKKNAAAAADYAVQAKGWQDDYVAHGKATRPAPVPPFVLHINDDGTETLGPDTVAPQVQPPVINVTPNAVFSHEDQITRIEQKLDWCTRMLVEIAKVLAAK